MSTGGVKVLVVVGGHYVVTSNCVHCTALRESRV